MAKRNDYKNNPWYKKAAKVWVSNESSEKPTEYDLVDVMMRDGTFRQAWWCGARWAAASYINDDCVKEWSKQT